MVVVYLYGEGVFGKVSIQYVLKSFADLNKAVRLISEEIGLSFRKSIDTIGFTVYHCTDRTKNVSIVAESTKVL